MPTLRDALSQTQRDRVAESIGEVILLADLSWPLGATTVLHVRSTGVERREFVIKAGDAENHHLGREIDAHRSWTAPLVSTGHAAPLVFADRNARLVITEYLPGTLVQGGPEEHTTSTHQRAGVALRLLHEQAVTSTLDYEAEATARATRYLDAPHRIEPESERAARALVRDAPRKRRSLAPTHGDWQPRNWLTTTDGRLLVIDWGRFARRPPATDLVRLAAQQWRDDPSLVDAFVTGYGSDPRDEFWRWDVLREAIGTAVWAFQVGDVAFEAQGHRMLAEAVAQFDSA